MANEGDSSCIFFCNILIYHKCFYSDVDGAEAWSADAFRSNMHVVIKVVF